MKSLFARAFAHTPLAALLVACCQPVPKAMADSTVDAWKASQEEAFERGFIMSTDGLTPAEEEAAERRESCEAFEDTGHALDDALATSS